MDENIIDSINKSNILRDQTKFKVFFFSEVTINRYKTKILIWFSVIVKSPRL